MIARLWHGLTSRENAGAYETLLRNKVLPQIHRVSGYGGAYLLKRAVPEGVEFVTLTFFESLNAVRAFGRAGIHVIAVGPNRRAAGLWSRYAAEPMVAPHPDDDPLREHHPDLIGMRVEHIR